MSWCRPRSWGLDAFGHRQEREVELVDAQQLGALAAVLLAHGQRDVRVAGVEVGERQGQVDRPHRVDRPDRDVADVDATQRLQLAARRVELAEDPSRPPDEQLAGLGQRDPPGGPFDQADPNLFLQTADLL